MINSTEMLKRLEPVVRPVESTETAGPRRGRTQGTGFQQLLAQADVGHLGTDRLVHVDDQIELDEEQRSRLERAADRAQAASSRKAVVLLDGRALVLDVQSRRVDRELGIAEDDGTVVMDVDAAVMTERAEPGGAKSEGSGGAGAPAEPRFAAAQVIRRLDHGAWPQPVARLIAQAVALTDQRPEESSDSPVATQTKLPDEVGSSLPEVAQPTTPPDQPTKQTPTDASASSANVNGTTIKDSITDSAAH